MAQFGSNRSVIAQNQSVVTDPNGNLIVSPDNGWTASPLGVAALNQVTIGVPNGTFNLLPANPVSTIDQSNPLPYWDLSYAENFVTTMVFDSTTQTWAVQIDPTAVTTVPGTAVLKTRIPVINDDGLDVRQYVASSLVQAVKVAGTDKWTATLTSQYYDTTGAAIGSPYTIGTIGERGTATVLGAYTNASGPINLTAGELELAYTVVVGTASPTYVLKIKSVMVATEYGVIGGGGGGSAYVPLSTVTTKGDLIVASGSAAVSRLGTAAEGAYLQVDSGASNGLSWKAFPNSGVSWVVQTFTSSGTWTKPAGVNYVTVVAMGGGQGGSSGSSQSVSASSASSAGGSGGATGSWTILQNVYVGNVGTVSVGIGDGGNGGSATVSTKAAAGTAVFSVASVAGANGAATTFGSYLSVGGGGGTAVTGAYWAPTSVAGTSGNSLGNGNSHAISAYTLGAPFTTFIATGAAGTTGVATGSSSDAVGAGGTATATAGLGGVGGSGGSSIGGGSGASSASAGGRGGNGGSGSGGGGAGSRLNALALTVTTSGGNGANAPANSGAGGGGGGGAAIGSSTAANYNATAFTMTTGKGGNGGSGWLAVAYPAIGQ